MYGLLYLHNKHTTLTAPTFGKSHGYIHRVNPTIVLDIKACQNVIHFAQWEQVLHFLWRYFQHINAVLAIDRRDSAIFLQSIRICG